MATKKVVRSAKTGKFVKKSKAKSHPKTTVTETITLSGPSQTFVWLLTYYAELNKAVRKLKSKQAISKALDKITAKYALKIDSGK